MVKPGLFAKVRVNIGTLDNATVVPEQAVSDVQGEKFVFVVDKDGKAASRRVTLGARVEAGYVVQQGVAHGDTVIVDGWQKVRTGSPVAGTPIAAPATMAPAATANATQ
jgi:membrane fusion protein (multidrug efflux system)